MFNSTPDSIGETRTAKWLRTRFTKAGIIRKRFVDVV